VIRYEDETNQSITYSLMFKYLYEFVILSSYGIILMRGRGLFKTDKCLTGES